MERVRLRFFLTLALVVVVTASGLAASVAQLPPGGTFTDDNGSIFEPSIEAIAAAGITLGCNPPFNDRFCPDDPVTRGQMAAFIVRALELVDDGGGNRFIDDDGSIFENDIDKLAAAGITLGCNPPDNTMYCPDQHITRAQMAAMLVRGYGYTDPGAGDWFVDDNASIFEGDIDRLYVAGVTKGCNPPVNDEYCPSDLVTRGQMAAFLQRAEGLTPIVPPPAVTPTLVVAASGLSSPVHLTSPPGDGRLFIVQKGGAIKIVDDGTTLPTPFLDITSEVTSGGEKGLLSMAFHPDYETNGRFFVYYSSPDVPATCGGEPTCNHTSVVAEYGVSGDPNVASTAETVIIEVGQPYSNHNGGQIEFGPDGYLYVGLGDGGSGNDPLNAAHNTSNLLGSILRLDVDSGAPYVSPPSNPFVGVSGADEIWAYGLRNPWRFAFDGETIYIGDVGQNAFEEVDAVSIADGTGADFGWRTFEGDSCTGNDGTCSTAGLTFPVLDYSHSDGCSVTGGRVYRGTELPDLVGHYFYADYCSTWIKSFRLDGTSALDGTDWTSLFGGVASISSFGEDGLGNLYVVSIGGTVYRLAAE